MNKISVAVISIFALAVGYGIGYRKAETTAALYLAEQYVKRQLLECTFDKKGMNRIKEGTVDAQTFLEERIQFRFDDLNHKLEKRTFWEVFVPSCLDSVSYDLNPEEIYDYLNDWNKSYQSKATTNEKIEQGGVSN